MPTVPEAVRPPATVPPRADPGEWARMRAFLVVTSRCWVFTGACADDGYGRFYAAPTPGETRSPSVRPSRWMWAAHNGPIPNGLVIRHRCDLTLCARPDCLLTGDQVDNLLDASRRDRITNMGRVGKADKRGAELAALAIRTALLAAVGSGVVDPGALAAVVAATQAAGDPYANQSRLF